MYYKDFDQIIKSYGFSKLINEHDSSFDEDYAILTVNSEGLQDLVDSHTISSVKNGNDQYKNGLNNILKKTGIKYGDLHFVFLDMYALAGFVDDYQFIGKPMDKIGDNDNDSNNIYYSNWFDEYLKRINLPHVIKFINTLNESLFRKINKAEQFITILFLRRLEIYDIKNEFQKMYKKLIIDSSDNIKVGEQNYIKYLSYVGLNYYNLMKELSDKEVKSESEDILKYYEDKLDDIIYSQALQAIKELVKHDAASLETPTIVGQASQQSRSAKHRALSRETGMQGMGKIIIDNKHTISTMATNPNKINLYIGREFYADQFLKDGQNGYEYFKTIVAHEAMHNILNAQIRESAVKYMREKYKPYVKTYAQTYHRCSNIVRDMFLNSQLEDWHFKIKPEWYQQFYFPQNGVKKIEFRNLLQLKKAKNNDPYLKPFLDKLNLDGSLDFGIIALATKEAKDYNFNPNVIAYDDEDECIADYFSLMVECLLIEKENQKNQKKDGGDDGGDDGGGDDDGEKSDDEGSEGGEKSEDKGEEKKKGKGKSDKKEKGDKGEGEGEGEGEGGSSEPRETDEERKVWGENKNKELDDHDKKKEEDGPEKEGEGEGEGGRGGKGQGGGGAGEGVSLKDLKLKIYKIENYKEFLKGFINSVYKTKPKDKQTTINRVATWETGAIKRNEQRRHEKINPDINCILVAVDTSGSISEATIKGFYQFIASIIVEKEKSAGGALHGVNKNKTLKPEEYFSIIPILWHDFVYYPTNEKAENIAINCKNYNERIKNLKIQPNGTKMSSVAEFLEKYMPTISKGFKPAGIIYMSDMDLYEGKVKLPPNIKIKMLAIKEPSPRTEYYGYSAGKFNPKDDIIYSKEFNWGNEFPYSLQSNDETNNQESFNVFNISGKLYKDI